MTFTSAFAAPEQAVVAALERIDYAEADPIREIVEDNVDPERALADHAFAHRLHARAGTRVVIGPGPLALGADLASGMPPDADTRAGRALALQALGVELALADGLPAAAILLGAVPDWVVADGDATSVLVQSWLRHAVFAGHRLVVGLSSASLTNSVWSPALMAALSAVGVAMVVVREDLSQVGRSAAQLKGMAAAAAAVRSGLGEGSLRGDAADRGRRVLGVAAETLARLAGNGWASVLGPAVNDGRGDRFGQAAVVPRADGPASSGPLLDRLI